MWTAPNITLHEKAKLGALTEDAFLIRMRAGGEFPGSPMPWPQFAKLTEDDLRAIFRYLATVPKSDRESATSFVATKG